jgi:hypothetical protein
LAAIAIPNFYDNARRSGCIGLSLIQNEAGEVVISEVGPDMPAAQSDIRAGDILIAVDGQPISPATTPYQVIHRYIHDLVDIPITITVRTGNASPRDYTFIRKPHANAPLVRLLRAGLSVDFVAAFETALGLAGTLAFVAVSALLFWRRPDNAMVLFTSVALILYGVSYTNFDYLMWEPSIWGWLANAVLAFGVFAGVTFLLIYPDGQWVPRWSRGLAATHLLWALAQLAFPAARPSNWPPAAYRAIYIALIGVSLAAQFYRYRYVATPLQRQQAKWLVFGLAVYLAGYTAWAVLDALLPGQKSDTVYALLWLTGQSALYIPPIFLAAAIGVALLRYRLFEIDFLINRSLVYGALTALLAALFGLSLWLVSLLFQGFAGGPLVAVAVSAAAFGALFQPAHRRLQRFVDQRFYNIQIDYNKTPLPAASARGTEIIRQTGFGAYQGLELIGRGGMAEVYKAIHPTLGTPVAIKIMPAHLAADPNFVKRFRREAQIVSRLEHPNIMRVFDFSEAGSRPYIVMEYFAGGDLARYLRQASRLQLAEALYILADIACALDYAHQQGLVHRDIKPANVMLEPIPSANTGQTEAPLWHGKKHRAVLTDFGIVKILGGYSAMTQTGIVGTLDYIAPEQIQAAELDGRADEYALGVMAYEMLTGELPFKQQNPGALLMAHLMQPPPDPREIAHELSAEMAQAIGRALAKTPQERYCTAGEFVAALST